MKKIFSLTLVAISIVGIYLFYIHGRNYWVPLYQKVAGVRTISEVVDTYGAKARERLIPYFEEAQIQYPPKAVTLLAIKNSAKLELWVSNNNKNTFIREYPIQALSGVPGPKLKEGDYQVPEGVYDIEYLNPNSSYHLSMKLNYPNAFDLKHAKAEGRNEPGTNIFIHGKAVSIGCLAMGDEVVEELFILATDIGYTNIQIAIAPTDPRTEALKPIDGLTWTEDLYNNLNDYFSLFIKK